MKVYILVEIWELDEIRTETVGDVFSSKELALSFADKLASDEDATEVNYTYEIIEKEVVEEC